MAVLWVDLIVDRYMADYTLYPIYLGKNNEKMDCIGYFNRPSYLDGFNEWMHKQCRVFRTSKHTDLADCICYRARKTVPDCNFNIIPNKLPMFARVF